MLIEIYLLLQNTNKIDLFRLVRFWKDVNFIIKRPEQLGVLVTGRNNLVTQHQSKKKYRNNENIPVLTRESNWSHSMSWRLVNVNNIFRFTIEKGDNPASQLLK